MSITITKMGHREAAKDAPVDFKCRACTCEFTATPPDYVPVHDQRDGNYKQATCPVCGNAVTKSNAV